MHILQSLIRHFTANVTLVRSVYVVNPLGSQVSLFYTGRWWDIHRKCITVWSLDIGHFTVKFHISENPTYKMGAPGRSDWSLHLGSTTSHSCWCCLNWLSSVQGQVSWLLDFTTAACITTVLYTAYLECLTSISSKILVVLHMKARHNHSSCHMF